MKPNNPQAFPRPWRSTGMHLNECSPGMSLRDHFAGIILHAFLADDGLRRGAKHIAEEEQMTRYEVICSAAYEIANGMLRMREAYEKADTETQETP